VPSLRSALRARDAPCAPTQEHLGRPLTIALDISDIFGLQPSER
jgi:hypothetical protein